MICSKGPLDKGFIFGVFHAEVVPLSNYARKRLYFSEMDTPYTKLRREQIFRQGEGIIEDVDELESAPTSFFVLTLNNHRLLYMREVAGAPNVKTFQATCQRFLRDRHRYFINKKYEDNESERENNPDVEKLTKMKIVQDFPYPELRITTLTDPTSLRTFVDQLCPFGKHARIDFFPAAVVG